MLSSEQQKIVVQYQNLVWKLAHDLWQRFPSTRRLGSVDALASVGNQALIDAVRLYNPNHPSKANFMTFAHRCIRRRMFREAAMENLISIPEKVRMILHGYKGRSDFLSEAKQASRIKRLPVHFDELVGEWQTEDERVIPLRKALGDLSEKDQQLLQDRYGLTGRQPMNYREIGKKLGVSKEAIRQRLILVLKKLRCRFAEVEN